MNSKWEVMAGRILHCAFIRQHRTSRQLKRAPHSCQCSARSHQMSSMGKPATKSLCPIVRRWSRD